MYEIGWFSTARGETSRLLLRRVNDAILQGRLHCRIAFVFCNRERGESDETDQFLDLVEQCGLPLVSFSSAHFRDRFGGRGSGFDGHTFAPWRHAYDLAVLERLKPFNPALALLAGYMLVMTPPLCARFTSINVHPAPPGGPTGTWEQVIKELINTRAPEAGAYMHLVTPELDLGPPVTYYTFPISGGSYDRLRAEDPQALFQLIRAEGVRREPVLITETLRAFTDGDVAVRDGRPVDRGGRPIPGYDLSPTIETILRETPDGPSGPGAPDRAPQPAAGDDGQAEHEPRRRVAPAAAAGEESRPNAGATGHQIAGNHPNGPPR